MHSLGDGTIDRLAVLRDRLEAEILRIPGTGLNGAEASRANPFPRRQHHQYLV